SSPIRHLHPFPTRRSSDLYLFSNVNYAVAMTVICAFVLCLMGIGAPASDAAAGARIVATLIGSALAMLAYLAWPTWERRLTPQRSEEHTSELQSLRHLVCR